MCRQHDRRAGLAVDLLDELPRALLGDHIQPDCRLVEVEDAGLVNHRCREVTPHPLTEAELSHRRREKWREIEQVGHPVKVSPVAFRVHPVELANQLQRVPKGQVPPELGALAKDEPDLERVLLAVPPRNQPGNLDVAGGRNEDPGKHLDRSRFACPVGAEVADQFALFDGERYALDRSRDLVLPGEECAKPAKRTIELPGAAELLGELVNHDDGHG